MKKMIALLICIFTLGCESPTGAQTSKNPLDAPLFSKKCPIDQEILLERLTGNYLSTETMALTLAEVLVKMKLQNRCATFNEGQLKKLLARELITECIGSGSCNVYRRGR